MLINVISKVITYSNVDFLLILSDSTYCIEGDIRMKEIYKYVEVECGDLYAVIHGGTSFSRGLLHPNLQEARVICQQLGYYNTNCE